MRGHAWSVEELAILQELWTAGATAETIGIRLGGLSRSAVLGKVFRLRLVRLDGGQGKGALHADRLAAADSAEFTALARRRRSPQRRKRRPETPAPVRQHKSLFELTNNTCRWPHGRPGAGAEKFFFCGAPEADLERGIPYCPQHMRRAYQTTPVPQRPMPAAFTGMLHRWR